MAGAGSPLLPRLAGRSFPDDRPAKRVGAVSLLEITPMPTLTTSAPAEAVAPHAAATFLTLMPAIMSAARRHFRQVRCHDRRHDLICEAVALGWLWHLRLTARGRDSAAFAAAFAVMAARAVNSGRRLCGCEKSRDALSPVCQRRRGVTVSPLPDESGMIGNDLDVALRGNTQTPIPDQVQFRLDFPRWLGRLPADKPRAAKELALGHRTRDVAAAVGVTLGRISQLRRELHADYEAFCDGAAT